MGVLGELFVKLGLDSSGFDEGVDKASKKTKSIGGQLGDFVGKWAGPAGLALVGKAMLDLGMAFEKSSNIIAKATGATGDELDALNKSMTNVMASGWEQSMEDAATATAKLAVRFKLTGEELTDMTLLFGDFADATNQEVGPAVDGVIGVIKKWGLETWQTSEIMGQLLVTQQKTGLATDQLAQTLQNGSTAFKAMGLSTAESLSMIAAFNEAGVDTAEILPAMNTAMRKFAESGIDAKTGFKDVISTLSTMTDDVKAGAYAFDVFGKQGPKVLEALKGSAGGFDALTKEIILSSDALDKTSKASENLEDNFKKASNSMQAKLKPVGDFMTILTTQALNFGAAWLQAAMAAGSPLKAIQDMQKEMQKTAVDANNTAIAQAKALLNAAQADFDAKQKNSKVDEERKLANYAKLSAKEKEAAKEKEERLKKESEDEKKRAEEQEKLEDKKLKDKQEYDAKWYQYKTIADKEDLEENERIAAEKEATFQKSIKNMQTAYGAGFQIMGKLSQRFGLGLEKLLDTTEKVADGVTGLIASGGKDIGSWVKLAVVGIDLIGDAFDSLSGKETEAQIKSREASEEQARRWNEERQEIERNAEARLATKIKTIDMEAVAEISAARKLGADVTAIEKYYAQLKAKEILVQNKALEDDLKKQRDSAQADILKKQAEKKAALKAAADEEWKLNKRGIDSRTRFADAAKWQEYLDKLKEIDAETINLLADTETAFITFEARAIEATSGITSAIVGGIKSGSTRDDFKTALRDMLKGMAIDAAILASGFADQFEQIGVSIAEALADGILTATELGDIENAANALYDKTTTLLQPIIDLFSNQSTVNAAAGVTSQSGSQIVSGGISANASMSGGLGANVTVNINSPVNPTPLETTRLLTQTMQDLSFTGVI